MHTLVLLLIAPCVAAGQVCGTCGLGCDGCDNGDSGSCGNACCKLDATFPDLETEDVMASLNESLTAGGADGQFTASILAEGVSGFYDLRPYNSSVDFIGQFEHTTAGAAHYNDSISLTVASSGDDVVVRLFSYSLIGGAYSDSGQNYKNLALVLESGGFTEDDFTLTHADLSCPDSSASAGLTATSVATAN